MNKETIPCKWCGKQTPMLGTKMCNGCWELDTRISHDLDLAERMVEHFRSENSQPSVGSSPTSSPP